MNGQHQIARPRSASDYPRPERLDASPREQLLSWLPVAERQLTLAGISTAVLEGGEGPPVILLHGPAGHAAHWMRIIPSLATTHRVVAPDLPGHGASGFDRTMDVDRALAWLDALVEQTCNSPPTLVGQLLGGAIAARFASRLSSRISRLVLVDSFGLSALRLAPDFAQALAEFFEQPGEITHQNLWRYCAFDLDAVSKEMGERWRPFAAYNIERARSAGATANVSALMAVLGIPAIPAAELEKIAVPTSLIWGRHDLATPLSIAEAASARFGWRLHVIENAADVPDVEQPESFMRALRTALAH